MTPAPDPHAELIRQTRQLHLVSKKDLADAVGKARSTVGRQVDQLIQAGYLAKLGPEVMTAAGRPRILMELNPDAGCFFGIDFEARSLFGIAVDFAQNTIARHTITHQYLPSAEQLMHSIKSLLQHLHKKTDGRPLLAIGVGVPGHVDPSKGFALHYEHIPGWSNIPLADELRFKIKAPVFLENNTRTMILAERWFGAATECRHAACINVRTGLSVAAIVDDQLLRGFENLAGEIRGWPTPSGHADSGGKNLEEIGSLSAILGPYAGGGNNLAAAWHRFTEKISFHDAEALEKLTGIATVHGQTAAVLAQLLNPEKIVLTGPLSEVGDLYLDQVKAASEDAVAGLPFSLPSIQLST